MIAIVKYNAGNIRSVKNALTRLGVESRITGDKNELEAADKIIFPGVGQAGSAMAYLRERKLDEVITSTTKPFLGICLGLQLMCTHSEEEDTTCLGIFDNKVKRFTNDDIVPHMGWNNFTATQGTLFTGLAGQVDMYYVHSYYAEIGNSTTAVCDYINPFSAAMQKDNFFATQFHPEKSAKYGQQLLKNFLSL